MKKSQKKTIAFALVLIQLLIAAIFATATHTLECDTSGSGGSEGVCANVITTKLAIASGATGYVADGDIIDCPKGLFNEVYFSFFPCTQNNVGHRY